MGMVALDKVEIPEDVDALRGFISEHYDHTKSTVAKDILDDFGMAVTKFVKVRTFFSATQMSCLEILLNPIPSPNVHLILNHSLWTRIGSNERSWQSGEHTSVH